MMQLNDTYNQKNSLFNAMNRFIGAVSNMDQTVMVPSVLRDVPVDEEREMSSLKSVEDDGDLYGYYQLLKSIRRDIEWGVRRAAAEERRAITRTNSSASLASTSSSSSSAASSSEEEDDDEEDLEKQFQFHLTGLHEVLSKLTQHANCVTNRYKQEVGIGGWGQ